MPSSELIHGGFFFLIDEVCTGVMVSRDFCKCPVSSESPCRTSSWPSGNEKIVQSQEFRWAHMISDVTLLSFRYVIVKDGNDGMNHSVWRLIMACLFLKEGVRRSSALHKLSTSSRSIHVSLSPL